MKNYLAGLVIGIVLALVVPSLLSGRSPQRQEAGYYDACGFDFIIPKPWYTQVPELTALPFIDDVVPYYMTGRTVRGNGRSAEVDVYLIEPDADAEATPFSSSLRVEGKGLSEGGIIVDERARALLSLSVGDGVTASFGGGDVSLSVCGIVRQNQFATRPTALVYYAGGIRAGIEQSVGQLAYSGAYVRARNVAEAEDYFTRTYRPLGKVGDRSWYKDDAAYEFMRDSITGTSAAKEVTNVSALRANARSNQAEAGKEGARRLLYAAALVLVVSVCGWLFMLLFTARSYRARIQHGTSTRVIVREFVTGQALSAAVFAAVLFLLGANVAAVQKAAVCAVMVLGTALSAVAAKKIITRR